ncbi:histidine phosphatase family protein [Planococcus alpniumensis]|uniref:histidine phosphatase family protein n=1 Tax=Planococcus alpniumensis TaxID=2708345 RepID=UPI001B8C35D0|nr:histidine phosphatase family protein [Planococcus sp. MSAK28401]
MNTFIYMVRHGDSPKEGNERTRGLTEKGETDARQLAAILKAEEVNVITSSPYTRSIQTVEKLAHQIGEEIIVFEDLKERVFTLEDERISDRKLLPLLEKSFVDFNYSLEGGESNAECQKRAIKVLKEILSVYKEQKIVIGTHGAVMTLMMAFYDNKYDLKFLHSTSKPDIYKMGFKDQTLLSVQRVLVKTGGINNS